MGIVYILILILGIGLIIFPKYFLKSSYQWLFGKNYEPSKLSMLINRIIGLLFIVLALIGMFHKYS